MPTGKIKWYDPDKGFGFISSEEGEDVYFHASVISNPENEVSNGQKVEFSFLSGRKGPQALSVTLFEPLPSVETNVRRKQIKKINPEELHGMIEDMIKVLEADVQPILRNGRHPEGKNISNLPGILRAIARQLES